MCTRPCREHIPCMGCPSLCCLHPAASQARPGPGLWPMRGIHCGEREGSQRLRLEKTPDQGYTENANNMNIM